MSEIRFTVKGHPITFDSDALTPEIAHKMLVKGCARAFFEKETGKEDKSEETLAASIAKLQENPNAYYEAFGTRGEGVSRPKLTIYERKAKSWFSAEFLPALKLGVDKAKAIWAKAGGISTVFTAKEGAAAEVKTLAETNVAARDKLIAAKAAKLEKDGWEPEL